MKRLVFILLIGCLILAGSNAYALLLFEDDFSDLSKWTVGDAQIVADPLNSSNDVLSFTSTNSGGDIFTNDTFTSNTGKYLLSFDYLGKPSENDLDSIADGGLGGFIGLSEGMPGNHTWIAGTDSQANPENIISDTGSWITYKFLVNLDDDPYRVMLEDFYADGYGTDNIAGDAYFDNIKLSQVPEPTTMLLFGTGLFGLAGFGRKKFFKKN